MKKLPILSIILAIVLLLPACTAASGGLQPPPTSSAPAVLTVLTHDSFSASEKVIAYFESQNNVKVSFIKSGDAGALLNRAILTKNSPLADVLYGVDNTFLSRALDSGIYEAYASPLLGQVADEYKLDPQNRALPVDFGDVCVNYDKVYFTNKGLAVPETLEDLLKPEYKGLLVVENPATSSTGLAFLLATVAHFGPDGYLDYWKALRANGVIAVNGWETAYYTNFSGSSGKGGQPLVVSYNTSPAAEVVFAAAPPAVAPTASILGKDTCFRQIEFAGILKGTHQRAMAEKFLDFILGVTFQEDMPLQMFVYPTNSSAKLPEVFNKYAQLPLEPARMDPMVISSNREAWISAWTEAVLK